MDWIVRRRHWRRLFLLSESPPTFIKQSLRNAGNTVTTHQYKTFVGSGILNFGLKFF